MSLKDEIEIECDRVSLSSIAPKDPEMRALWRGLYRGLTSKVIGHSREEAIELILYHWLKSFDGGHHGGR